MSGVLCKRNMRSSGMAILRSALFLFVWLEVEARFPVRLSFYIFLEIYMCVHKATCWGDFECGEGGFTFLFLLETTVFQVFCLQTSMNCGVV